MRSQTRPRDSSNSQNAQSALNCVSVLDSGLGGSKLLFTIPGTSSLCFTRPLLTQILPMPEPEAIALNDSYLQFAAILLSKGVALAKLALLPVHEGKAYTLRTDKQRLGAKISIITAYSHYQNHTAIHPASGNNSIATQAANFSFPLATLPLA